VGEGEEDFIDRSNVVMWSNSDFVQGRGNGSVVGKVVLPRKWGM